MAALHLAMGLDYGSVCFRASTAEQCAGIHRALCHAAAHLLHDLLQCPVLDEPTLPHALFSLATLPNTIFMGVPILRGMYDAISNNLMVQMFSFEFDVMSLHCDPVTERDKMQI
ncbi:hypothetical protein Cni_G06075 [Canna indica]|uniref:Uncharacterized protein n=1 Tax=Canna indica TaxID=4628 RepID=A0AAQ3JYJ9_9LILI|nr:hypothetical protein Cni_G06075 [Canna indica]